MIRSRLWTWSKTPINLLKHLPPSEAWFAEARSHAQKGAFALSTSDRVNTFVKRDDFTTVSASLASDVMNC